MKSPADLNIIAEQYHSVKLPDHWIEFECQLFELDWLLQNIPASSMCLDLGFGDGVLFPHLAGHCKVTLLEASELLCRKAKAEMEVKSLYADVHCTLFEEFETSTKFDVIVCSHVLEHVGDPVSLLRKLHSLLTPKGLLIGIVPNADSLHRRLGVAMGMQQRRDELSPRDLLVGHQRVYSLSSLVVDLARADFEVIKHRGFFLKPLANSQLMSFSRDVIEGLLRLSNDLATEICGNIGFVATALDSKAQNCV